MRNTLKFFLTLFCLNVFAIQLNAQNNLIISPGINYQNMLFYEVNAILGKIEGGHAGQGITGYRVGLESNLNSNFIWAPKVGVVMEGFLLQCWRVSIIPYFQNGKTDLRLMPEIGLSWFGTFNLTYGYKIKLLKDNLDILSNHRIGLNVNLNRDLWKKELFFIE